MTNQTEQIRVIYAIFDFLYERNPLVLASILSNAAYKDSIKYYYENWQYQHTMKVNAKLDEDSSTS